MSSVGEPRPVILHTGSDFTEALALSFGTQVFVLFVMLFMPFYMAVIELFPFLFVIWILAAYGALYRLQPKVLVPKTERTVTQPGYPIDRKIGWGYALLIASAGGDLFAALAIEIGIAGYYADLQLLHLFSVGFAAGGVIVVFVIGRGYYLEVKESQRVYEFAEHYNTLKAAHLGNFVLGHQFEHTISSKVPTPSDSPDALPGEVIMKTILQRLGSNGSYLVDLASERNPHVVVLGTSGIGKTEAVRTLVLRNWIAKRIPSLIIDWANQGYAEFTRDIGGVVWSVPVNFRINPLKLVGLSPTERVEEFEEAIFFSLGLTSLQASEVGKTVLEQYNSAGIVENDPSTWSRSTPTISDIVEMIETRIKTGYYKGEFLLSMDSTVRKFHPVMRIFGEEETDFFDTILQIPTCVDLSSLSDQAKAQVSYTILQRMYRQFDKLGHSKLRLLTILDEAQLILAARQSPGLMPQKPLPVRIVEQGRKFGFGVVTSTHLVSNVPEEIRANAATIILLGLDEVEQVRYLRRWVNLSPPELETYAELPKGGCFVKHNRERYSALVRVQMASQTEFEEGKTISSSISIPKAKPSIPTTISPAKAISAEPSLTAEEKLLRFLTGSEETISLPEETPAASPLPTVSPPAAPSVPTVLPPAGTTVPPIPPYPPPLTPDETRVLNTLRAGPITTNDLLARVRPKIQYLKMLDILNDLDELGLIQVKRVANLEAMSTIYYAALREEWIKSEGIEHRAMVDMLAKALVGLRPVRFDATNPNTPDLGLENSQPRTCIEVETGLKKLSPEELDEWASNVNERDSRLGYKRVVVVVPSVAVERRYAEACKNHNLGLTTMANVLAYFGLK